MMGSVSATKAEARVLIVDDEPTIVELLSVSLRFQGFEVETAANGAEGLDRARGFRPDALILDVMMPGMDGFGLLRRLRADGVDAPVLFLTARDAVDDKVTGLTLGADDYVTKPFSLEEVVARLRVILRRAGTGRRRRRARRGSGSPTSSSTTTPTRCGRRASRSRCRRPSSPCCGTSWSTRAWC